MHKYTRSILNKYGIENVENKLLEEITEWLESGEDAELSDIFNVILTINEHRNGKILEIAEQKRNRTTLRMACNWYDADGQNKRKV